MFSNHIAFPCCRPSPFFSFSVPGAPPRKLEVEAINSTAIRVTWKPPLQGKQHGQIRGYQVIFSRLENGEPRSQPNIMDVALPEAQVLDDVLSSIPVFSFTLCCALTVIVILHCTSLLFHSLSSHFISPIPRDTHGNFLSSAALLFFFPLTSKCNIWLHYSKIHSNSTIKEGL